jgi:hypothetical protein
MARIRAASLLALSTALANSQVFAFPSSRLVYARGEGAESCPSEGFARHAVATRLGYDPFFPSAAKTIVAEIVREHDELRGRVELVDEQGLVQGAREFRTPLSQCDELVTTMALAISIAVDPESETSPPGPAEAAGAPAGETQNTPALAPDEGAERRPDPASPDPELPREADAHVTTAPPPPSSPPGLEPRLGLSFTSSFGTAPDLAIGLSASVGLRWNVMSFGLEGRADWPASGRVATGGVVRVSLLSTSLVPCFHPRAFFVCAVGTLGSLQGSGDGLVTSQPDDALYGAVGFRGGFEVQFWGPMSFRAQLEALANLTRAELRVDGLEVWRAPPFSGLFGAGVVMVFP